LIELDVAQVNTTATTSATTNDFDYDSEGLDELLNLVLVVEVTAGYTSWKDPCSGRSVYRCRHCTFNTEHMSLVIQHVKNLHITHKAYSCTFCDQKWRFCADICRHLVTCHANSPLRFIVNTAYKSADNSGSHSFAVEIRGCGGDDKTVCSELERFVKRSNSGANDELTCVLCNQNICVPLKRHLLTNHLNVKQFCCKYCLDTFKSVNEAREHSSTKHASRPCYLFYNQLDILDLLDDLKIQAADRSMLIEATTSERRAEVQPSVIQCSSVTNGVEDVSSNDSAVFTGFGHVLSLICELNVTNNNEDMDSSYTADATSNVGGDVNTNNSAHASCEQIHEIGVTEKASAVDVTANSATEPTERCSESIDINGNTETFTRANTNISLVEVETPVSVPLSGAGQCTTEEVFEPTSADSKSLWTPTRLSEHKTSNRRLASSSSISETEGAARVEFAGKTRRRLPERMHSSTSPAKMKHDSTGESSNEIVIKSEIGTSASVAVDDNRQLRQHIRDESSVSPDRKSRESRRDSRKRKKGHCGSSSTNANDRLRKEATGDSNNVKDKRVRICKDPNVASHEATTTMYECMVCTSTMFASDQIEVVMEHIRVHHLHIKRYSCNFCSSVFYEHYADMAVHFTVAHPGRIVNASDLAVALQQECLGSVHTHEVIKVISQFDCDQCNFVVRDRTEFEEHIRAKHWNYLPYTCSLCSHRASSSRHILAHLSVTHDCDDAIELFVCELQPELEDQLADLVRFCLRFKQYSANGRGDKGGVGEVSATDLANDDDDVTGVIIDNEG
jgi:hypothetical protein